MFAVTFMLRSLSFIAFGSRPVPPIITYIGQVISPAIIAALIVYCFRNTVLLSYPYGIPEILATAICIVIHLWKRNAMLSIIVSTLAYMVFIQKVFVTVVETAE